MKVGDCIEILDIYCNHGLVFPFFFWKGVAVGNVIPLVATQYLLKEPILIIISGISVHKFST